jgi:serine/threonine protein kinase/Tol biopolymer transport system component
MTADRWSVIERLYHEVVAQPAGHQAAFLSDRCGADDALRHEVESLLAHERDGAFLSTPVAVLGDGPGLRIGQTLGPYVISARLGEGGMGEVYQARDTRLGRDVAIKVLPAIFASDPDRLARFEREARMLAALNHPHIGAIYGVEHAEGIRALVLELVEGNTLADRLRRGPLPIAEALTVARQIADALDAAHEKGIIHRDLKPANIKITPSGVVKVLDFGLAKASSSDGSTPNLTQAPSVTVGGTRDRMILGTPTYMSPEQARGNGVDKRADIWAFGVVLFEMLTGTPPFEGDGISETLARVIEREPAWDTLPTALSPALRTCLVRCLQKVPGQRMRDIGDVRLAMDGAFETATLPTSLTAPSASSGRLMWTTALGVAAVVIIALAIPTMRHLRETPLPVARPLRVSIVHTEGTEVVAPAISPDGQRVAYRARRADGMPLLWVRDLVSGESRALPGTEDPAMPFWSPDSRDLGFFTGVALKRVPAAGGPVRVVVDDVGIFGGAGGAWGADGTIVFSGLGELSRVPADGGAVARLTNTPRRDWSHLWPSFLPDGRRFLFVAKLWTGAAEASEQGIYLGSLDSPTIRRVLPDLSSAVYAPPGYVIFVREGTLTAAPFDLATGRVTGPPTAIGGAVATDGQFYFAAISASADGTLAVRPPPAVSPIVGGMNTLQAELHLVDRDGRDRREGVARLFSSYMALSPVDSRTLAAGIIDPRAGTQDLWLMDLTRDNAAPLTTTRGFAGNPVWSADGRRLAYAYEPPAQYDHLYIKDISTGTIQRVIATSTTLEHPVAWSHDDKSLLVFTFTAEKGGYLSLWSFASRTLTQVVGPGVLDTPAFFSPHDDFVAFNSQESGRPEVYVTTFPDHRQRWPLTAEGGRVLSWRNDGREILVATLTGHIAAYPVSTVGGFSHGEPTTLVRDLGSLAAYSTATPDHSHILIRVSPDAAKDKGEIQLVFGWQDALPVGKH